ncbi:helix-turn-helix domain-containing protein, partial [Pseudomonas sp. FW305-BF15]
LDDRPSSAADDAQRVPETVRSLAQSEQAMIDAALKRHAFNVSRAAAELGLTRAALYRRMARYGL